MKNTKNFKPKSIEITHFGQWKEKTNKIEILFWILFFILQSVSFKSALFFLETAKIAFLLCSLFCSIFFFVFYYFVKIEKKFSTFFVVFRVVFFEVRRINLRTSYMIKLHSAYKSFAKVVFQLNSFSLAKQNNIKNKIYTRNNALLFVFFRSFFGTYPM